MMKDLDVAVLTAWLDRVAKRYAAKQGYLCDLDAAIGDGDHGASLTRGFTAVAAKIGGAATPGPFSRRWG